MTFDEVALTPEELKALKTSIKSEIPIATYPRLYELNLVDEISNHVPGYAPVGTGFAAISNTGINYLAYISATERARRKEHTHNWFIAIFSTIGGALLSEPLWGIIHRIADFLCDVS